jgi:hypothetical protein
MKTHIVIDLTYHEDENNQVFAGTETECYDWVERQGSFGYEAKPMTKEELRIHNPECLAKSGKFYNNVPPELGVEVWEKMSVIERLEYKGLIKEQ